MKALLTTTSVQSLKPPAQGQIDVWDKRSPGFGIRVSMGGTKTWIAMYRKDGHKRRLVLGRFPGMSLADARTAAKRYLGDVAKGLDPATAKAEAKAEMNFAQLAELYIERHAIIKKRPRSVAEDKHMLALDLLPCWKDRKISTIRRQDIIAVLDGIVARGAPVQANRVQSLISKILNFAVGRGLLEVNPAHRIPRSAPEHSRDRVLSDHELRSLWIALGAEPAKVATVFKLLMLTAARRSEVLGMGWSELDLDGGWWTIPAQRSKNGLAHRVPLVPSAVTLLRRLQEGSRDAEYVFRGGKLGTPVANPQKWLSRLRRRAALDDFRLHDIRRSVASNLTGLGISRLTVSKLLNHVETGITAVYDRHSYDQEKRAALMKWERHLIGIIDGQLRDAKVVAIG
jgi:integrase